MSGFRQKKREVIRKKSYENVSLQPNSSVGHVEVLFDDARLWGVFSGGRGTKSAERIRDDSGGRERVGQW